MIGFISIHSGLPVFKIFDAVEPSIQVRHIFFGNIGSQRIRRAFGQLTVSFCCNAICPLRDNSQLMKTFAALGWGARFTNAKVPNC